jgi:hypothetical protein
MSKYVNYTFENCEVHCDCKGCPANDLIDSCDFSEINKELKSYGWIITKIDDEWKEFCSPECLDEYMGGEGIFKGYNRDYK